MNEHAFTLVSLNIHKGLSPLNRRLIVHELKGELDASRADVVCLQEVQGRHTRLARRFPAWPEDGQGHFLAGSHWPEVHYARNAVYEDGHHGNAILSRFPVESVVNDDMSMHRFERRGLLHAVLQTGRARVHCFCIHLGLTEQVRQRQIGVIVDTLARRVPAGEPVVLAGDFNDWRNRAGALLAAAGLSDAFSVTGREPPRTFPARLPLLRLDRIYVRGLVVEEVRVMHQLRRLSDHAGLFVRLAPPPS